MIVRKIKSQEEMDKCVDMYIDIYENEIIPLDRDKSLLSMRRHVAARQFFRVVEDDGEVIAWIAGAVLEREFIAEKYMQQIYYCSNQKGMKSYRCVVLLHQALVEEAKALGIKYVLSTGSHADTENVFVRILGKNGWNVRGYLAIFHL
jgi:hypothetical protein